MILSCLKPSVIPRIFVATVLIALADNLVAFELAGQLYTTSTTEKTWLGLRFGLLIKATFK